MSPADCQPWILFSRRVWRWLVCGLLLASVACVSAMERLHKDPDAPVPDPERRMSEYVHDYWKIEDGLPQNTVLSMVQDAAGYLWIGTFEGLARYDGHSFERTVPDDAPELGRATSDLVVEPDETLWVGTGRGGLFRRGSDGSWRHFTTDDGLASNSIVDVYRDPDGVLWVGTSEALCHQQGERFDCTPPAPGLPAGPVTDVINTPDGAFWIATEFSGLYRLEDGKAENFRSVGDTDITHVDDLDVGPDGRLWGAGYGAGLIEFDGEAWRVWGRRDGLTSELVRRVVVDGAGSVWIGTYGAGVQRLRNGALDRLATSPGLPNSHVQSLLLDREGSLWFGTSGGLNRLRAGPFITVSTPEGLSGPFVRSVTEDASGAIWVGTDSNGLNLLRSGLVQDRLAESDLLSSSIRSLWPASDGGLWIGSYGGGVSYRAPDGSIRHYRVADGLASSRVRAVLEDSRGDVWVGADRNGITRIERDGRLERFAILDRLRDNDVRAIAEAPDGAIWFGTYGHGLARRSSEGRIERLPALRDGTIFAIHFEPDGGAWIGSSAGLHYLVDPQGEARSILPGGAVFQVLDDGLGYLWLCSNRGVVRLSREDALAGGGRPDRFGDRHHGLRSRQCNGASQAPGWRAADGTLWFATAEGIAAVDPGGLLAEQPAPKVTIERVDLGAGAEGIRGDSIEVPAGTRRMRLDYVSLTLVAAELVRYRYRLIGYDDAWVDAGDRRSAFYNDLRPGSYSFEVEAANASGIWNGRPARLTVIQRPTFFQTVAFQALMLLLLLGTALGIGFWRGRVLRARNAELERAVQERTRQLSASNNELERTVSRLRSAENELVETRKQAALASLVAGVAHEVNTPVGNSLTLVTHLRMIAHTLLGRLAPGSSAAPDRADLARSLGSIEQGMVQVEADMERAASIVRSFKRIDTRRAHAKRRRFQLATLLETVRLSTLEAVVGAGHRLEVATADDVAMDSYPDEIREILMLLVSNSLEHAFAAPGGVIRIDARVEGEEVVLRYRDDGGGIDRSLRDHLFEPFFTSNRGTHTGLGMHIVYNLVHGLLGGTIALVAGPGARFELRLPVSAPLPLADPGDD